MKTHGIQSIDLLVVNLYPFEETIAKEGVNLAEAIENIDIGGPAMLRSASKNYQFTAVVVNPSRYNLILDELKQNQCTLSEGFRLRLAQEAFAHTAHYDLIISNYLESLIRPERGVFPVELALTFQKVQDLRYGENPHQKAALYRDPKVVAKGLVSAKQLHGKPVSFNNILDLDTASRLVQEFSEPCAVIIKHNNPCGVALGKDIKKAYEKALRTDPVSAFGGILGFNQPVNGELASLIGEGFVEAVIAPDFTEDALKELKKKKNLILLTFELSSQSSNNSGFDLKKIDGGLLIQEPDHRMVRKEELRIVTQKKPSQEELESMLFAWTVAKHVKSNAIVLALSGETVGIGAGQMSRVDSVKIAIMKAQKQIKGCVMASDAFFPFRDGIDVAADAGVKAVIQPGGSIRDEEVIRACDEKGIIMALTGVRHFRH
jgi:phosphoribosylaminoimidazolecarboxamide formyltransferase/IMP cyclohydrolase